MRQCEPFNTPLVVVQAVAECATRWYAGKRALCRRNTGNVRGKNASRNEGTIIDGVGRPSQS